MTYKETRNIKLLPGYWWENIAPLGEKPDWEMRRMPEAVDFNAPQTIFGYDAKAFMSKQYR